jgi:flagellar protein FlaG
MAVSLSASLSAVSGAGYGGQAAQQASPVVSAQSGDKAAAASTQLSAQQLVHSTQAAEKPTREQLKSAMENVQKAVQKSAPGLEFSIDEDLGATIVKLVDSQTREVVRQFPSEEMLQLSKSIERMQGLLVSKVA